MVCGHAPLLPGIACTGERAVLPHGAAPRPRAPRMCMRACAGVGGEFIMG